MNHRTYRGWRAEQVEMLGKLTSKEHRKRYRRGLVIVWGELIARDVEARFIAERCPGTPLVPLTMDQLEAAEAAWHARNKRIADEQAERRVFPINLGSRLLARDPSVIAEEREGRTCKGCLYEYRLTIAGDIEHACTLGRHYGAKCAEYYPRSRRASG